MKRTRLTSPKRPIMKQHTPVATALIMSATTVVTNSVSPSALIEIEDPNSAITITSAGDRPAIAPRYPLARAIIRHAAKFPNSTRPTPWEE